MSYMDAFAAVASSEMRILVLKGTNGEGSGKVTGKIKAKDPRKAEYII